MLVEYLEWLMSQQKIMIALVVPIKLGGALDLKI
jgi:hypothetical protein